MALLFGDHSDYNPHRYFVGPERGWQKYYRGPVAFTEIKGGHGQFFREPNVQILTSTIKKYIDAAKDGTFVDAYPRTPGATMQALPPQACRATIEAKVMGDVRAGEPLRVEVAVTNAGGVDWMPTPASGLFIANCWIDGTGKVCNWLDGRTPLLQGLAAGQSCKVELRVKVPAEKGRWTLRIDVVDEGVGWFQELGSTPWQRDLESRVI